MGRATQQKATDHKHIAEQKKKEKATYFKKEEHVVGLVGVLLPHRMYCTSLHWDVIFPKTAVGAVLRFFPPLLIEHNGIHCSRVPAFLDFPL